jgi:AcrR family transcriptional regulator
MPTRRSATTAPRAEVLARGPKRADARRNYDALVSAARDAFATGGTGVALEEIARRAGVGIGTLYRHFPNRQQLLEAVYVREVDELCRAAEEVAELPGWTALATWLQRFVAYTATKRAILEELAGGSPLFSSCFDAIVAAGAPILERAQSSGEARADVTFDDLLRMISGITMMPYDDPAQRQRIVTVAIDGMRTR